MISQKTRAEIEKYYGHMEIKDRIIAIEKKISFLHSSSEYFPEVIPKMLELEEYLKEI